MGDVRKIAFQKAKAAKKMILQKNFYLNDNVVNIAQSLLGKWLFTEIEGEPLTGGIIIETEAYAGPWDKAAHSYNNRQTKRTEPLFQKGGLAYVYLCYGMHLLFNITTGFEGIPHAVLIRAIEPKIGIETMLKRRKKSQLSPLLTAGPGTVCQALGIGLSMNFHDLTHPPLWLEQRENSPDFKKIIYSPRIGVDYAKEHAHLPWRYQLSKNS